MKPGSKFFLLIIFFIFFNFFHSQSNEKVLSSPLINLNELKPSFEEEETITKEEINSEKIKSKKTILKENKSLSATFIGLDKITAKTSEITINLGESKKFGPLEIKVLKCGKFESNNKTDNVAYLQVKDLSESENEKVFIFNGWTFSSDPTLAPFDHAIYDLQLVYCTNV